MIEHCLNETEQWQQNQIRKHQMESAGREAERRFP